MSRRAKGKTAGDKVYKPRKKRVAVSVEHSPVEQSAEARHVAMVPYVAPPPKPRTRREIVAAVCERIVQGDRIHAACEAEKIVWKQLWLWKAEDAELQAMYLRAREASAESFEDHASRVADEATADNVQVARLQVDTHKWRARVANPSKFAERVDLTSQGARIGLEELVAGSMKRVPAES